MQLLITIGFLTAVIFCIYTAVKYAILMPLSNSCTPWTIKTCHSVFDYNSVVTCSIFTIFVPVERGRNALQFTYLMTWWRHNSVTIYVTKFYFIRLVLKIKYVEFEDGPNFFIKKPLEMWKFFCQKTDKRIFYLKIGKYENWTTCCKSFEQLVRSNALWWLTSKCAAYTSF